MVFAGNTPDTEGLYRISASGGDPELLIVPDRDKGETSFKSPTFLPGGEVVLFGVRLEDFRCESQGTSPGDNARCFQIAALSLETGKQKVIVEDGRQPHYLPSGHLVYERRGTLWAAPFDLEGLEMSGEAVPILEGVSRSECCEVDYALSQEGSLVYVPNTTRPGTLVWVDRNGRELGSITEDKEVFSWPQLSPGGERLAVTIQTEGKWDIWIYDLKRGTRIRLLVQGADNRIPVWTPDGTRLLFAYNEVNLSWKLADGSGDTELLLKRQNTIYPSSFFPDGQTLAFFQATNSRDIWTLPLQGDPSSVLATPFFESSPMFSPDGKWLAYVSNESGQFEVYVQSFPGPGGKSLISTRGGLGPRWSADGSELFYRQGQEMMVVPVKLQPTLALGEPKVLFEGSYAMDNQFNGYYDVSQDGQRFLMVKEEQREQDQIRVILNWFEELKRLVPSDN